MRRPCLIPIIDNQLIGFVGWFVRGVLQKKNARKQGRFQAFYYSNSSDEV